MRVRCISKDTPGDHPDLIRAAEQLQVGSIYTVIDEDEDNYELSEFYHPWGIMWDKSHFAPLSNLDETELVTEEFNEKYCIPVK